MVVAGGWVTVDGLVVATGKTVVVVAGGTLLVVGGATTVVA